MVIKIITMGKICIGCGHRLGDPLGVNKYGEPFRACCPDSRYVERQVYDLDWLHRPPSTARRSGNTVRLCFDIIGTIMVTNNEKIYVVVGSVIQEGSHIKRVFDDILLHHFDENPFGWWQREFGIQGYSSTVRFIKYEDMIGHQGIFLYDNSRYHTGPGCME